MRRAAMVLGLALLAGCDTRETMEARQRFEITRAESDIVEARRVAAAGGDPTFACRAVRQMIAGLESAHSATVSDTIKRGRDTCLPLSLDYARSRIERLEAAKPGKGRERLAAECVDLSRALVLAGELAMPEQTKEHAQLASLDAKRKLLCP